MDTRYWFEAGRFNYQGSREADMSLLDGDTVFFETAEVILRDEDQRLAAQGLPASGNPLPRAFSCAWTRRMDEIYRCEARDMHNMFGHVAVTRVTVECKAFARIDFAGDFLLHRYPVRHVPPPAALPGLRRVDGNRVQQSTAILTYFTLVCGGISIDFLLLPPPTSPSAESRAAASKVFARRPSPSAVSWSV